MQKKSKSLCLLLIAFLICPIYLPFAFAQPSLISSDNVLWSTHCENGYIEYSREISQSTEMPVYVDIKNLKENDLIFGWKQEAKFPGIFGNMKFTTNGSSAQYIQDNSVNFTDSSSYPIDNFTKYQFELSFKKGGKVWIRFPLVDGKRISDNGNTVESKPKTKPTIFSVKSDAELHKAINNSSANKLIYLADVEFNGPYYINKSNITLTSQNNNRAKPIINGNAREYVIAIEDASNVLIDGLIITNAFVGILLEDDADCSIKNCTIKNFDLDGISLNNSSGTSMIDNQIISPIHPNSANITGINLTKCQNNCKLINNTIQLFRRNNGPIPIDLLLDRSQGNILSINPQRDDEHLIFEDEVDWAIKCDGSYPCCRRNSGEECDCSTFKAASQNHWLLCGSEK
jgi:parallel beta-helix repeat protein